MSKNGKVRGYFNKRSINVKYCSFVSTFLFITQVPVFLPIILLISSWGPYRLGLQIGGLVRINYEELPEYQKVSYRLSFGVRDLTTKSLKLYEDLVNPSNILRLRLTHQIQLSDSK